MSSTPHTLDPTDSSAFRSGRPTILPPVRVLDHQPDLAGRYEERYLEDASLGRGGVGEVVRAIDLDIGRRVAIKRLRSDRRDQADVARFVREVRLVGALEHPNIVPLHDVGQDHRNDIYAVMKWVDGQTLEGLIEALRDGDRAAHRAFNFTTRTRIFMEICRGVAYAHEHGVLHRDLKPANVMVGHNGEVQILDWGLAKQVGHPDPPAGSTVTSPINSGSLADQTMVGAVFGTPAYMAPEQARGEPYTERTEVFALGVLFWELLTLQRLVDEDVTAEEAVVLARTRRLPWAMFQPAHPAQGAVPAPLSWFVDRAVNPDPAERFESVAEMMEELRRVAAGWFPVQCPGTLQRRVLAAAGRFVDRAPMISMMVAMMGVGTMVMVGLALGILL